MKLELARHFLDGYAIGLFGAGHLGRALAHGLLRLGLQKNQIVICHRGTQATRDKLAADGLSDLLVDARELLRRSRIVFYLVRPQHHDAIANYRVRSDSLFVSFLAGIPLQQIAVDVSEGNRVRVMTSAPDTIRRRSGIAAIYSNPLTVSETILEVLESLGLRVVLLSQENDIHAFTALGPCLPIALRYWSGLGKSIDELEIWKVARRHALPECDATIRWALSTLTAISSAEEQSHYLAQAVTPGGVTDAIITAIDSGMCLSRALEQGIERSREFVRS